MTKVRRAACSTFLLLLSISLPASAQTTPPGTATLRATGTFGTNGSFAGTVTVNRFEQRAGQIVAIGVVQGTLSRANRVIGTGLAGEIAFPVRVSAAGVQLAIGESFSVPRIMAARWNADLLPAFGLRRTQAPGCTPVQVNMGATTVDLLGAQVALDPIGLTLVGAAGTPLGDLVCAAADLVGNVAGVVNLLNRLLAVLTGLLGGVAAAPAGIAGA